MASLPTLTRADRAYRREKVIRAYLRREGCSRTLAERFGFKSDGYVRAILRAAGVARRPGNLSKGNGRPA